MSVDQQSQAQPVPLTLQPALQTEIKLYQSDFLSSTYCMRTPGTYLTQEDIECLRPGISIERGDVVLDQNGYELRMSRSFSRAVDSPTSTTWWANWQNFDNIGNGMQCAHDLWDKDYNAARADYKYTNLLDFIVESETSMRFLVYSAMPTLHVSLMEPPEKNYALCEYVVEHWRHKFCDMLRRVVEAKGMAHGHNLLLHGVKGSEFEEVEEAEDKPCNGEEEEVKEAHEQFKLDKDEVEAYNLAEELCVLVLYFVFACLFMLFSNILKSTVGVRLIAVSCIWSARAARRTLLIELSTDCEECWRCR